MDRTSDVIELASIEFQKFLRGLHSVDSDTSIYGVPSKSLVVRFL